MTTKPCIMRRRLPGSGNAAPVRRLLAAVAVAVLCMKAPAWGVPENGVGLYTGPAAHDFVQPLVGGGRREFSSAGWSLSADAQFVWNDQWSVNPMVLVSLETITDGNIEGDLVAYSSILQVRRWWADHFLGAHIGIFKELIRTPVRTLDTGDGGVGFAIGREAADEPLWYLQYDWERVLTGERIQALRLQLGYRWR